MGNVRRYCFGALIGIFLRDRRIVCWTGDWRDRWREFIAGKRMIDAGRAGWGSLLGNLGAMMGKLFIALVMITIFFYDGAISVLSLRR